MKEIEINTTRRRRITVLLTIPAESGAPRPAVVTIHGHGGTRHQVFVRDSGYRGFAAGLAERGYVTIGADVGQHELYEANHTLMEEPLWVLMWIVLT